MENKTFIIAGREFMFKDLTIDESEEAAKIASKAMVNGAGLASDISGEETKRFLFLVLKPADNKPVNEAFFGQTTETDFIEIFSAFFLRKIVFAIISAQKLAQSMKDLAKLSANSDR